MSVEYTELKASILLILDDIKGGAGSGNRGHAGRPGHRGGSASKVSASTTPSAPAAPAVETPKEQAIEKADLTRDEAEALIEQQKGMYSSQVGGYSVVNRYLRDGKLYQGVEEKDVDAHVAKLDSAFRKSPAENDMVLYRGVKDATPLGLKVGEEFTDKAFVSTSKNKEATKQFRNAINRGEVPALIEIHVPKGHPVIDVEKATGVVAGLSKPEREMLLPRNTRFKVESFRNGKYVLKVVTGTEKKSLSHDELYFQVSSVLKGGAGSGNHAHASIVGHRGGSATRTSAGVTATSISIETEIIPKGKEFNSLKESYTWGIKNFSGWRAGLTDSENNSLDQYQMMKYGEINRAMRGIDPSSKSTDIHVENIQAALEKGALEEAVEVYRGAGSLGELTVGSTITDKAFMSTSLLPGMPKQLAEGKGGVFFQIHVPKGTPAGYLDANRARAKGSSEQELLLGRELTLRIVSIEKVGGKHSFDLGYIKAVAIVERKAKQ